MESKITILYYLVLIFLIINLLVLILPDYSSHRSLTYSSTVSTEDPQKKNLLWEIGKKNYSSMEFDQNPGPLAIEYIIHDEETEDFSDFPRGLSKEYTFLPYEICLRFSINQNHSKNLFSLHLLGEGNFTVYFDSIPITDIEIYTGIGWETIDISLPYILSNEHMITLETKDAEGFAFFDYLHLTGYPDTDQDGICDLDEGDEDSDDDGLKDDQDADCTLIPSSEGEKILLMVRKKDDPELPSIPVLREVSLKDTPSIRGTVDGPQDIEFLHGFVSGRIDNLETGQEVELIFSPPQSVNLYEIEQIWIYDDRDGSWVFPDTALDKENRRFHILLKDGDSVDTDGETDAHIAFNLGLGVPTRLSPYPIGSCFLGSMKEK